MKRKLKTISQQIPFVCMHLLHPTFTSTIKVKVTLNNTHNAPYKHNCLNLPRNVVFLAFGWVHCSSLAISVVWCSSVAHASAVYGETSLFELNLFISNVLLRWCFLFILIAMLLKYPSHRTSHQLRRYIILYFGTTLNYKKKKKNTELALRNLNVF